MKAADFLLSFERSFSQNMNNFVHVILFFEKLDNAK